MKIAIAQLNTKAGDFTATSGRMAEISHHAADQGVELLVFPLTVLTGPFLPDYADQEGYALDLADVLVNLADAVACPCIVPVMSHMDERRLPETVLLHNGSVSALAGYGLSSGGGQPSGREELQDEDPVGEFVFGGMRFGLAFTYDDMEDLLDYERQLDAVLFVSGYSFALDDPSSALGSSLGENRFRADARALDAWILAAGSLGGFSRHVYTGSSFVLTPAGELVASAPAFEESLLVAEIGPVTPAVVDETLDPEIYDRSLHLWQALGLSLCDHLEKQGRTEAALVLDGSLASCLLATLASDALGPTRVHALLGVPDSSPQSATARKIASSLRISLDEPELPPLGDEPAYLCDIVQAAAARMARSLGAVLLSFEDKTYLALEASAGRCRAAELLPFGDVYRTDLLELAHLRNTISSVIPADAFARVGVPDIEGICDAEPTPEMQLNRLDRTLATYIEWERSLSDVVARQGSEELTVRILDRLRLTAAARACYPPYLVVSSKTLGDVRIGVGNAWRDHVRTDDERLSATSVLEYLGRDASSEERRVISQAMQAAETSMSLENLQTELLSEALPEGVDRAEAEAAINELLGLIRDLVQNGGQNPPAGPFGPMTWGSPFSEN